MYSKFGDIYNHADGREMQAFDAFEERHKCTVRQDVAVHPMKYFTIVKVPRQLLHHLEFCSTF